MLLAKGEAQQAADLQSCGSLRIDGHVDVRFLAQQAEALVIFGVADAGDGVLCA